MSSAKRNNFVCCAFSLCLLSTVATAFGQKLEYSTRHREHTQEVAQTLAGPRKLVDGLNARRSALSVAVAQMHLGGAPDLVTGYATATGGAVVVQRGSMEAFAPSSADSIAKLAAGDEIPPFSEGGAATELPLRPDFLLAPDTYGTGHSDLMAGQRGLNSIVLLSGSAGGGLSNQRQLALRGGLTALTTWRTLDNQLLIVAAVKTAQGSGLQLLQQDGTERAYIALGASATAIDAAQLNRGHLFDLVVVAGGAALVLDGDSILTRSPHFDTLPVSRAVAIASGNFVWDHRPMRQLAVLTSDATLHVVARTGLNSADVTPAERAAAHRGTGPQPVSAQDLASLTGTPWSVVETIPGVAAGGDQHAILLASRFSVAGGDDLVIMSKGQYYEINHITKAEFGLRHSTPVITVDSTPNTVAAAVPARISAGSRMGIVSAATTVHPFVLAPSTFNATYYVNSLVDGINGSSPCTSSAGPSCNLRDALQRVNANSAATTSTKPDRILLLATAGTYKLTQLNPNSFSASTPTPATDNEGDANYHLNIQANVDIVGQAGCTLNAASTATACGFIVDANGATTNDIAFAIDSAPFDNNGTLNPYAVFMSGFQIQNGLNTDNPGSGTPGNGSGGSPATGPAAANSGGLIYGDTDGGIFTLYTMVLTGGHSKYAYGNAGGGAVALFNSAVNSSNANVEIDYSTLSSNKVDNTYADGGALYVAGSSNFTLNYDILSSNVDLENGGGVYLNEGNTSLNAFATMTGTTISGNSASESGGGISLSVNATMTNLTVTGNSTNGSANGNTLTDPGGGIYIFGSNGTTNLTSSTITGNTLTNNAVYGAGIAVANNPTANINYNRIYGNSGGAASSTGLVTGTSGATGTNAINAKDNWWGCNHDPQTNTAPCSTAVRLGDGALTTLPYTTLTLALNNTAFTTGNTVTAVASLGQDSSATVYTAAQDFAYLQAPISSYFLPNASVVSYSPSATAFGNYGSNGVNSTSAQCTTVTSCATSTASGTASTPGSTNATITVDGQTLTKPYTITGVPDLSVTSSHSGNFKAGDTADTYALVVGNIGNGTTTASVTLTDTLPAGLTAVSASGTGWSCSVQASAPNMTCTRSDALTSSVTYPTVTLTVSVSSATIGTLNNTANVSGGGETNTNNDSSTDPTIVVGVPTITESFSPTTVSANATSTVTFTIANPSANSVSLTGVAFSDSLPSSLKITTAATTTCTSGTATGAVNATTLALSGATIASGATCTVTAGIQSTTAGTYTNTSGNVTATNSNAGGTASATLTVVITPTKLVYTAGPATPIIAGGNAGTITVALEDAAGNINTADSSTVVSISVTSGAYSAVYSVKAANGVSTFNLGFAALNTVGTYTYTASVSGLTSAVATETVNPGAAAAFAVSGFPSPTSAQLAGSVTVKVLDSHGNIATGFTGTVAITTSDSNATLPANYTFTASDAGVHPFSVTFNTALTQSITATSGSITASQTGIVVTDAIWVLSNTGLQNATTESGTSLVAATGTAGTASPYGALAIDAAGLVWSVTSGTNSVFYTTANGGTSGSASTGGLNAPVGVAIDGSGNVWVVNSGNNTVSEFANNSTALSTSVGFATGGTGSNGIAIDTAGSVWVTNGTSNTVTRLLGAASPVVSPTSLAVKTNVQGTRP